MQKVTSSRAMPGTSSAQDRFRQSTGLFSRADPSVERSVPPEVRNVELRRWVVLPHRLPGAGAVAGEPRSALRCRCSGHGAGVPLRCGVRPGQRSTAGNRGDGRSSRSGAPLRRFLHAELKSHFAPVAQRIRELLPVGSRAAWGNVGDKLIQAAAWIMNRCHGPKTSLDPHRACTTGSAWYASSSCWWVVRTRSSSPPGRAERGFRGRAVAERGSCCLQYRAPCGRYCANCPAQRRQEARIAAAVR